MTTSRHAVHAQLSTTDLVARCLEGDQDAWDDMVRRYGRLVHYVARQFRLSTDECDDVAQHCWLQLIQKLHTLRDPERCGDWLAAVARNESMKVQARGRRAVPTDQPILDIHVDPCRGTEEHVLKTELHSELYDAIAELPERAQEFVGHFLSEEDLSYAEVADLMGMRPNSVGQTRTRYLRRLRAALNERGVTSSQELLG